MIITMASLSSAFVLGARLKPGVDETAYPFTIPSVRALESLNLDASVTFLIGENGSGKSTIIEALALSAGFNEEGGTKNFSFSTKSTASVLTDHIQLVRSARREKEGFFLRAESFYNVSTEADNLGLRYGEKTLHEQSHGESFLAIANHRFAANGLYILDEPEAALSPQRQLAFLARMHDLVQQGSQFIIATHSPILLAYPGATIYELNKSGVAQTPYEDTAPYEFTLDFLTNHKAYIKSLLSESPTEQ